MVNSTISGVLKENEEFLKNRIGESFDTKYRHFYISAFNNSEALIVYISGLVDIRVIDETILASLMESSNEPKEKTVSKKSNRIEDLMKSGVFTSDVKKTNLWEEICDAIIEGDTVLFLNEYHDALVISTRKYETRTPEEPSTESEVKAPRDGFVENIQTNAALIRRRIKDHGLRFDSMKMGDRTKTIISIAYIDGLVNSSLLSEVKKRLGKIKADAILGTQYLEEMIEDAPHSVFPQIANTERPDRAAAALLEGRIVILGDNTPFALVVPAVFWQFFISASDYYSSYLLATFIRWVRFIALFLSISFSSLYVLLSSFHQEMLPTALALKIAAGRQGVPYPAVIEAFIMETILEIMKEAGLHMPKPLGQTVSIVGTLVIGQAAVAAGLISPLMVIVISVAAIASFAIPAYNMSNAVRLIRFFMLFLSATLGLLGYLGGVIFICLHLMSLRSFGSPYLAPVIPFDKSGNKDVLIRSPWWVMRKRPNFIRPKDKIRQVKNLKPKAPKK